MRATLLTSAVCHAQWFNRMTHLSTYLGASITSWMMYLFNCSKRKYRLSLSSIRLYRCYIPYQTALRSAMFVTHDPAPTLNLACNSNTHQSDPLPCDVVSIIPCCVVVSLSGSSNDLWQSCSRVLLSIVFWHNRELVIILLSGIMNIVESAPKQRIMLE
jgi:hypothetical protein